MRAGFSSFVTLSAYLVGLIHAAPPSRLLETDVLSGCPSYATCLNGVNLASQIYATDNGTWKQQSPPASDVVLYSSLGFNTIRYAFSWRLLQPNLAGPYDSVYFQTMTNKIRSFANDYNMTVIVNCHMFGQYDHKFIGQDADAPTADDFAVMWTTVARQLKHPNIMLGLMNEPTDKSDPALLQATLQTVVNALRDPSNNATLDTQYLLLPSNQWQGINTWPQTENYTLGITDPKNHTLIDIHNYFDYAGGSVGCQPFTDMWIDYYRNVTETLRANGRRAFMSEIGGRPTSHCVKTISDALTFMDANADVWVGYTAWGPEQAQPANRTGVPAPDNGDISWTATYIDCGDGDLINGAFRNHGVIGCRRFAQNDNSSTCTMARDSLAALPSTTGTVTSTHLAQPMCNGTQLSGTTGGGVGSSSNASSGGRVSAATSALRHYSILSSSLSLLPFVLPVLFCAFL